MGIHSPAIHVDQFEPQLGDLRFPININAIKSLVMNVMNHPVYRSVTDNNSPHDVRLAINPQAFVRASSQGGSDEELLVRLHIRRAWGHWVGDMSSTYESTHEPTWSVRGFQVVC